MLKTPDGLADDFMTQYEREVRQFPLLSHESDPVNYSAGHMT